MSTELLDAGIPKKSKPREDLDNVNGTLAMGIISIVLSLVLSGLLGLGVLLLGTMAIVKGKQAMSLYNDYPEDYTKSSYLKGKAGFVCGIIGVSLWGVLHLLMFLVLAA